MFNAEEPLKLWIVQLGVIVVTSQFLALILSRMRQPTVIAEIAAGIILGPTALGRIPGFAEYIFPTSSIPYLSLTANIGLILFLFIVGLEIDISTVRRNARISAAISSGIILSFSLGALMSLPLYNYFIDPSTNYSHFLLFVGVSYSITAFPVLCRILSSLKLLDTNVGVCVLSAGVGNDIIGWILLAFVVALVNAGSGYIAIQVLFGILVWTLVLMFPVRIALHWFARRSGSVENGPSITFLTVTVLLVFASAYLTDYIGVQAIFGGFLVGLIIPRENGLTISLAEKLEDVVTIVFLPLYFTISGLFTNLGLLDGPLSWIFLAGIVITDWLGKFCGAGLASRAMGFQWREAATIGTLMTSKGLVELIVLNIGLQAGILTPRVFSMFVLEALILTFSTSPIVEALYPVKLRLRVTDIPNRTVARQEITPPLGADSIQDFPASHYSNVIVVLDKLEHLPGAMSIAKLLRSPASTTRAIDNSPVIKGEAELYNNHNGTNIDALRLIELTDRTSAYMKSYRADLLHEADPILSIFRSFARLNGMPVASSVAVASRNNFAACIVDRIIEADAQLLFLPWLPPPSSSPPPVITASADLAISASTQSTASRAFDYLMHGGSAHDHTSARLHTHFIKDIFSQSPVDVALFIDKRRDLDDVSLNGHHIFLPFFGGPDDRCALAFVLQLCMGSNVTATAMRIETDSECDSYTDQIDSSGSEIDDVCWEKLSTHGPRGMGCSPHVEFITSSTKMTMEDIRRHVANEQITQAQSGKHLLAVLGRSSRLHRRYYSGLLQENINVASDLEDTIGALASAFLDSNTADGLVVIKSRGPFVWTQ
ncbi:hypothetical protein SISNIDRAFT_416094 [Sistotremastrum niveocremeum HHB9708]|uniref:Cation/H+ exchanger transmembrane domain-containing protein n=1 Tax=Sistotremastrum niveocremeum HHB9708 TaxID=1314777 RepID=A0A164QUP7_9AGAM|nr:hypothetical protein SISNIDRAFT_416094 [Sistotremastrum niveocremeum HHB9708]